jgi:type IV pilus assembly protein PilN
LIKINLLPVKRAGKKTKAPADEALMQLGIGLGVVLIFLGACGYRWQMLVDEVALQTQLKESKTKEVEALKKKVQEVEDYEKKKLSLENQVRIIEQLRKNQGGPVRLLDYLSQSLDPLKVWLSSVEGDVQVAVAGKAPAAAQVTVAGKALTNDDIVEFIKNLQQSKYFSSVTLQESVQATEEGVTVYSFKLTMTVKG